LSQRIVMRYNRALLSTRAPALKALDYAALARFRLELRRFLGFSERVSHAVGLEPQQHQLLLALRGFTSTEQLPTIGNIAEWLLIQHHSAVELVDRAAARGLVQRQPDPDDRRRVLVELTADGDAVLAELSIQHREELENSAPALIDALSGILGPRREQRKSSR
jgi:DNA-binding MarR family transcriptional regulator